MKISKIIQLEYNNKQVGKLEINNSSDTKQELFFYGDIVSDTWEKWTDEDTCPKDITDFLNTIDENKELHMYINSGGGSVWAGIAIYNQLKRKKCKKVAHIDGLAASISSVIPLSADEIIMYTGSQMMVHKPWCSVWGGFNADDFINLAKRLDVAEETILDIYMEKAKEGITREKMKQMLTEETWLSGKEAEECFYITVENGSEVAAAINSNFFERYKNKPNMKIKNISKKTKDSLLKDKLLLELELSKI